MLSLIVLAGGKSTRMQGKNKLLVNIDGKPMIRRVVETGLSSKVDEVIVVLGWEADKIRKVLASLPCRFTLNKDYERGQSSSVKAGLTEVDEVTCAILVLPGDIAKIDSHSINLVVEEHGRTKAPIVVAAHNGKLGHPILLARPLFGDIAQIDEQTFGLKSVIKKHQNEVVLIEVGSENVLKDIDTLEDLTRM